MTKTTFLGYVPSLKSKHEATIVNGRAMKSKGGSIRYLLEGEYDGRKTLPKTVSKADFENVYGFDAKEAESVILEAEAVYITGIQDYNGVKHDKKALYHQVGKEDEWGFEPKEIIPIENKDDASDVINEEMDKEPAMITNAIPSTHGYIQKLKLADTVGSPSPADVEPPAPSEKPFPQEPSNENFSAETLPPEVLEQLIHDAGYPEVEECEGCIECAWWRAYNEGEGEAIKPCPRIQREMHSKFDAESAFDKLEDDIPECCDGEMEFLGANSDGDSVWVCPDCNSQDTIEISQGDKLCSRCTEPTDECVCAELYDAEGESDYWAGENAYWRAEGHGKVMGYVHRKGAEYAEDDICFVCSNPDTENEVTYCESDADCGKAICDDCRYEEMFEKGRGGKWVKLDEDPEDDNSAMADVCRECADNNEPVLFEAFGLFGGKDEEEEEEKPKEQEFTVVLQEGDKLELTDIEEDTEGDEDDSKDDNGDSNDSNDENEEGEDEEKESEYEAVSAKVTRPVKEEKEDEEKEEEGMSTLMKVGLGVGALAVSAAILGAEERVAVMWEGKDDNNNGLIYGIEYYGEDGEFSDVEWFRTADQRDAMLLDSDGESDYWEGENAHWRAEGSGEDFQKMTSSEFVPFDQITAELQEEWDETTIPVAADYEPLNEPTNANFSAEDKRCSGCFEIVREGSINEACNGEMVCDECWNCAFCENCDACTDHQECECGCEVCGYTECECETKEAETKNMNWVIGLTALGVGVAALGYSDKILALFDRFKK